MFFRKILQRIFFLYAMLLFLLLMLLLFPFMAIAALFGRVKGGNMVFRLCTLWADLCYGLALLPVTVSFEKPHDKTKPYIFIINHISYLDASLLVKVLRQPARVLGKAEMGKIPIFGFIYKQVVVTVDRGSTADRAKSIRVIKSLLNKRISVVVFPEGTFNTTHQPVKDFYSGAFRVAIETQTPIKPILFLGNYDMMPRSKFTSLKWGRSGAVYLDEIPVSGLTITDMPQLKQKAFEIMSGKLREYKASWIEQGNDRS